MREQAADRNDLMLSTLCISEAIGSAVNVIRGADINDIYGRIETVLRSGYTKCEHNKACWAEIDSKANEEYRTFLHQLEQVRRLCVAVVWQWFCIEIVSAVTKLCKCNRAFMLE